MLVTVSGQFFTLRQLRTDLVSSSGLSETPDPRMLSACYSQGPKGLCAETRGLSLVFSFCSCHGAARLDPGQRRARALHALAYACLRATSLHRAFAI